MNVALKVVATFGRIVSQPLIFESKSNRCF